VDEEHAEAYPNEQPHLSTNEHDESVDAAYQEGRAEGEQS